MFLIHSSGPNSDGPKIQFFKLRTGPQTWFAFPIHIKKEGLNKLVEENTRIVGKLLLTPLNKKQKPFIHL